MLQIYEWQTKAHINNKLHIKFAQVKEIWLKSIDITIIAYQIMNNTWTAIYVLLKISRIITMI